MFAEAEFTNRFKLSNPLLASVPVETKMRLYFRDTASSKGKLSQSEDAIFAKVDCFVTADLKYHDYFKAENKLLLVDVGHYESEQYTKELILEFLNKKIPKFACIISKTNTNPVNYF